MGAELLNYLEKAKVTKIMNEDMHLNYLPIFIFPVLSRYLVFQYFFKIHDSFAMIEQGRTSAD
jgi:hypothetical protein